MDDDPSETAKPIFDFKIYSRKILETNTFRMMRIQEHVRAQQRMTLSEMLMSSSDQIDGDSSHDSRI